MHRWQNESWEQSNPGNSRFRLSHAACKALLPCTFFYYKGLTGSKTSRCFFTSLTSCAPEVWRASLLNRTIDASTEDCMFLPCLAFDAYSSSVLKAWSRACWILSVKMPNGELIWSPVLGTHTCFGQGTPSSGSTKKWTACRTFASLLKVHASWQLVKTLKDSPAPNGVEKHPAGYSLDSSKPSESWRHDKDCLARRRWKIGELCYWAS